MTSAKIECTETNYVRHNGALAGLVSLKTLPQGFVTADTMRYLTATRNLRFPFEVIVDFSTVEKSKAKKDLQKRIDRIDGSKNTWLGFRQLKKDAVVIKADLENLLEQVEGDNEEICQIRLNVIVFGGKPHSKNELLEAVKTLDDRCDECIASIRKRTGADAIREDAARQRAIYPRMLAGELSHRKTGQELVETADSVIAFVPTETNWRGSPRPHSIFTTPTNAMFGLDLYDRSLIKSPTVIVTAASGEGKSFLATMLITDIRAHRGQVKVRVMDYRYSFKPICRLFNGRHIEFNENEPKPINIWNYPGIEAGKTPTKRQLAMVLTDVLILSKTPRIDAITSAIAATVIDEVYKMAIARNGAGRPKFQPTLGHFLDVLKSYHWSDAQKARADELYLKLNIYRKDPWLNAPTHADYDTNSMFDVFELSTISQLDEKIRESVGFRISAQIMQEIGEEDAQQQKTPILFICDEVREINKHFPAIQELMAEASVTGRKEGLVTILFSQAYEHFTGTPERPNVSGIDLVKNSGVKIIGKQIGGFERLADDCELSKETIAAVRAINNQYGRYTQWLMVVGSGGDKIIEMAEVHASPTMVWANTNDTNEANARRLVENLQTGFAACLCRQLARPKISARADGGGADEFERNGFGGDKHGRDPLMKNKTLSFPKQILMSLLLTSILLGFDVKPAKAQWTVFDPTQYNLQVAKKIEEAARWVETINQYVAMYEKASQQYQKMVESVTNLRGILDKVDEQIIRHKQLITTYAQLGRLIRGTFELKRRIENTITSQIQSVVNISRRLRNGIFDMDQNKRDLDDFLRHSIGRRADAELQNLERLAKLDSELERMLYDRELVLLDLAKLYEEREKIADKTKAIDTTDPANQDGVQSLIDQMLAVNLRITTVEGLLRDLEAKIQEKFVKYGIKIEQMTKFGDEIQQSSEMMTGITRASDEFMQELEHWDVWREEIYDNNLP